MKTIGMIGGMSWESSLEYYRLVNQGIHDRLGGFHSAKCVMVSVDFSEIELLQHQDRWEEATARMIEAARQVVEGGADFLVICTNTMHKMADEVQASIPIPLLHIVDAAAEKIRALGMRKVGLLGTRFTMEEPFYKRRLEEKFGLEVLVPGVEDRNIIHRVIFDELVLGVIKQESREEYKRIIAALAGEGAEGIILGCTEIGLLVKPGDSQVPLFDTTIIHAEAAVEFALRDD